MKEGSLNWGNVSWLRGAKLPAKGKEASRECGFPMGLQTSMA